MSLVDDLSEQALALASQENDDAAVAELVRIAGGDRVADILRCKHGQEGGPDSPRASRGRSRDAALSRRETAG
jgi:hypothetical protein